MTDQENSSGPAKLAELSEALRSGEQEARIQAIRDISTVVSSSPEVAREGLDLLIDVMGDDDWQVRKEAVAASLLCQDTNLLAEKLVEAMAEPDNVGRRNAVIEGVMKLGGVTIDPLLRALKEKPEHRKVLVDVLGTFGDSRVVPALAGSLLDEDPNVRAAAMEQIASFPASEVGPALEQALDSADLLVVLAALEGLNRQQIGLPVTRLAPLLDKVVLRPALMTALGNTKDVGAVPHLIEGLLDRAKGAREAALVALVQLHESSTDPQLRKAVESAATGMSDLAMHSTVRALMEANAPARAATATLLGWTGRKEMVRPLMIVARDTDPSVVAAAEKAIASLGQTAAADELRGMIPNHGGPSR
jgi:HEAT repeat protein